MIEVVDRRDGWVGLRSRPATDWKRALVEYGTYSIRAKWRSLRSARASMLKKVLDTAGIVRDACYQQQLSTVRSVGSLTALYSPTHTQRETNSGGTNVKTLLGRPLAFFVLSLLILWLSAQIGAFIRRKRPLREDERDDFALVINASLTLLALIIGSSFSMAVSRYDQRKNYEEEEANAIGTEYVRADLLPAPDGAKVRKLLERYLEQRILFYTTHDSHQLDQIDSAT